MVTFLLYANYFLQSDAPILKTSPVIALAPMGSNYTHWSWRWEQAGLCLSNSSRIRRQIVKIYAPWAAHTNHWQFNTMAMVDIHRQTSLARLLTADRSLQSQKADGEGERATNHKLYLLRLLLRLRLQAERWDHNSTCARTWNTRTYIANIFTTVTRHKLYKIKT